MKRLFVLVLLLGLLGGGAVTYVVAFPGPMGPPQDRPLPARAEPPAKIVAFGTSLTDYNDWPARVGARLGSCLGTAPEVIEVAGPGQGTAWALDNIDRVIAEDPDMVLIEFSINDADILDGVWMDTSQAQHRQIIGQLQRDLPEAQLVLLTMNPAYGKRGILRPLLPIYYGHYQDFAETYGLGLVDAHRRWLTAERDIRALPDGLHPTDAQVAAVLVAPLADAIAQSRGQPNCPAP